MATATIPLTHTRSTYPACARVHTLCVLFIFFTKILVAKLNGSKKLNLPQSSVDNAQSSYLSGAFLEANTDAWS